MQPRPLGELAGIAALALSLVLGVAALLPLAPTLLSPALDQSFAATLHFSAAHGDGAAPLICPFGPLGFVYYDLYEPATYAWLVAVQAVLAAAICSSLAWIGWMGLGSAWGAALLCTACTPFLAAPDVRLLTLPLLVLWLELSRPPAPVPLRVLLGAAVAIAALVKFTACIAALLVLGPLTLHGLITTRRLPIVTWSAAAAALVLVWIAGPGWREWPSYLYLSLGDITLGYSSAMQLAPGIALVLDAVAATAIVFIFGVVLARRRWGEARWAALAALAGVLFMIFKAGFVRADVHVFITAYALLVIALLVAVSVPIGGRGRIVAAAVIVAPATVLLAHAVATNGWPTQGFRAVPPHEAWSRLLAAPRLIRGDLGLLHAANLAKLRAELPVPPLRGPVDIYPFEQGIVLANQLELRPRPIFQSYMAYTPRLAGRNAAALGGARAPEWVLFRPRSIDNRLPALDDAPSWPRLLTGYSRAGDAAGFTVLRRRSTPATWTLRRLGEARARTGEPIAVPSDSAGPIWARVEVERSLGDRLLAVLLSGPRLDLALTLSDGRAPLYTFIAASGRGGFLLSPLIAHSEDFARLMEGPTAAATLPAVTSLRILARAPLGSGPQRRGVAVEFFRLEIADAGDGAAH